MIQVGYIPSDRPFIGTKIADWWRKNANISTRSGCEEEHRMEKMKLMLVDDEERFLVTTQKLLARKGCDALIASSGSEALKILQSRTVHVIILDVKMPGMDGIETLREIKRHHPLVEVIMLTGHATVESAVDGLRAGACDYLMKPTGIDELLQKAEEAFARRRQVEEKIRMARARKLMKSPREILREDESR
jgi:DNA-binding NtrC family response regulator